MEQIRTKIKKWGNSFGIVIPAEIVNRERLKEDSEVFVTVQLKKYTTVGDLMELAKKFKLKRKSKKSTQEIMDEIDRELWPEGGVMEYFFDTCAIIEVIEGNENYKRFSELPMVTTTLNVAELYFYFLREHDEQTADYWIKKLNFKLVNIIKLDTAVKASRLKFKNKKENLSYTDCIGYILSKELNLKFLTSDSKFKNKENVEFVK